MFIKHLTRVQTSVRRSRSGSDYAVSGGGVLAHVRRQQVRNPVLDLVRLTALGTDQRPGDDLVVLALVGPEFQVVLVERATDDVHQILFHTLVSGRGCKKRAGCGYRSATYDWISAAIDDAQSDSN